MHRASRRPAESRQVTRPSYRAADRRANRVYGRGTPFDGARTIAIIAADRPARGRPGSRRTNTATMTRTAPDRMPPVPEHAMTAEQRAAIEEFMAARGTTRFDGPFVPLLRSPELLSRARNVGDYVRFNSVLPKRLSEFVILITARHWTQQYEWALHSAIAAKAGLSPEIISAVADGRRPAALAADEASVYAFCTELLRTHGVSDSTYAGLRAIYEEKGVIDTIGIIGYYSLLAMVMNTARTPLDDGISPPLPTLPR